MNILQKLQFKEQIQIWVMSLTWIAITIWLILVKLCKKLLISLQSALISLQSHAARWKAKNRTSMDGETSSSSYGEMMWHQCCSVFCRIGSVGQDGGCRGKHWAEMCYLWNVVSFPLGLAESTGTALHTELVLPLSWCGCRFPHSLLHPSLAASRIPPIMNSHSEQLLPSWVFI